ncbi:MAG: choline/ethanolamine kinase family protein [Sulfitobacter sp.]
MDKLHQQVAALSCFSDPQDITPLGGGLTNVNVLVSDGARKYVVRLGADIPEHGVMRWNELALSKAASAAGFSPKVIHFEPGVMVLDFIEAKTFTENDVRDPENLNRIVALISKAHRQMGAHLTQPALAFWPYHVNRTYISRLLSEGSAHSKALPEMLAHNTALETATGRIDMVLSHNDLLAANILDDGQQLWLIDWEYGGFNSPLFDLAGLASNNGLSQAQERAMLAQYFDADADQNWQAYSALKCASLMRETLWSMTSEIHSDLDVDFGAYTGENMDKLTLALADFAQM